MRQYAVLKLDQCPDCDEEGYLNGNEIIYTEESIAQFDYLEDAVNFAKSKGDECFVIDLNNGFLAHTGVVRIDTRHEDKLIALQEVVRTLFKNLKDAGYVEGHQIFEFDSYKSIKEML